MPSPAWHSPSTKLDFNVGIWSIYHSSRVVGLWPFSITSTSNGTIRRTQFRTGDAVWLLISMCLLLAALINSIYQMHVFTSQPVYGTLSMLGFYAFEITNLVSGIFAIVFDLIKRDELLRILQNFTDFDSEVSVC